jgi:hypothetical protein
LTDFRALQVQHVNALKLAIQSTGLARGAPPMSSGLARLLDALPYYANPDWTSAHRGTLANVLATNMPNDSMTMWDSLNEEGNIDEGYRDCFYGGVVQTAAAQSVMALAAAAKPSLDGGFWSRYSVSILADAARLYCTRTLNDLRLSELDDRLNSRHAEFLPALTASVLAVYESGFAPTSDALAALSSLDKTQALSQLTAALASGDFAAEVNPSLEAGGEITAGTVWFLYVLWVTLRALGAPDVDALIAQGGSAGLEIPAEVGPHAWWEGGYSYWYAPLSGRDVSDSTRAVINADWNEVWPSGSTGYVMPHGFTWSFMYWGALA